MIALISEQLSSSEIPQLTLTAIVFFHMSSGGTPRIDERHSALVAGRLNYRAKLATAEIARYFRS